MIQAFPKPKDQKHRPKFLCDDGVFRYPDGREVCDLKSKKGMDEYQRRKQVMWDRQGRVCGLIISPQCKQRQGRWPFDETQFGHEVSRGGGKRDDRIEIEETPHNRTICAFCNSLQGSRPMSDFIELVP